MGGSIIDGTLCSLKKTKKYQQIRSWKGKKK